MKRLCPEYHSGGKKVRVSVKLIENRLVGKCPGCGCLFSPNIKPS